MNTLLKNFLVILISLSGISLFLLSNHIGGLRAFTVMSASMEPAIQTGSMIISLFTHPSELSKGDIITFIPPGKNRQYITHRITQVTQKGDLTVLKTKGDNNKNEDAWNLAGGGVVGKVIFTAPHLGYFLTFAQSKIGIILFILLPASYIIIDEIFNMISIIKKHRHKPKQAVPLTSIALLFISAISLNAPPPASALLSTSTLLAYNNFEIKQDLNHKSFPHCSNHEGDVIAHYATGMHEIIGVGLKRGSDIVYQLSSNSKDRVLQCYCSETGEGIQTNWLKSDLIDQYPTHNWTFYINSGLSWNLDDYPYVAENISYSCA